ncbi:MAG: tetratricopeptide repeat protein [Candidatus Aminicenantes bacterium]|jgi:tetratricopeptide (TPR) repeat protein
MAIIYNVTIEPAAKQAGKESRFRIYWHNVETNTGDFFEQFAGEIMQDENWMVWQNPLHQLNIGRKLFCFLDGDSRHLQKALEEASQQGESLHLHLHTCTQVADWPFELLAHEDTFLLPHRLHLVRRVSDWGSARDLPPQNRQLKLLFMACSALDVEPVLDFEREEEAIFHITEKLPIEIEVEDSGSLAGLREQLEREQYDVVHLSGHADIDDKGHPYFIMENETGHEHKVFPDDLWNEGLIENPPRLLFLSGCRTGETPDKGAAVSFARMLVVNHNLPAVLGWGRSVADQQATHAEKVLYHELSRGRTIPDAVKRARYELIREYQSSSDPAWPLLRLFSSGIPLNPLVQKGQRRRPKTQHMTHIYLKNSQVRVLKEGFVGRRRQLQSGLRALRQDFDKVGVLLLGTGGLGKSCLAGKICERFTDHTLIIVQSKLNAIKLEAALTDAFIISQDEKGQKILSQKQEMTQKLANLCATSFKEKNYLLLLDDFQQNLEGAEKGQPGPLRLEAADLLKTLFHYLPFSGNMTQLIITCRYEFSLTEHSRDLAAERLEKVWLTGFQGPERRKKAQALKNILNYADQSQVPQLLSAGCGNPLLMEWLDVLLGQMKDIEVPKLTAAIKNRQEDFIREYVMRELLQQGGKDLALFLQCFSIYRCPVQIVGVQQVAEKAGIKNWADLLKKGMGLSLIEHDQARQSYQLTPLLREELLLQLKDPQSYHQAAVVYYKTICESQEFIDPILVEEWIFHALGGGEEKTASQQGGRLVKHLRERLAYRESRRVGLWITKEKNQELSDHHDSFLLNELAATLKTQGDYQEAIKYFDHALTIDRRAYGNQHLNVARDLNNLGTTWRALGEPDKAIEYCEQALNIVRPGDFAYEHPNFAGTVLDNLGSAWGGKGDYEKAIEYYKQALTIWKKEYGERHPHVAISLNNLGSAWNNLGNHQKAAGCFKQALTIDLSVFGKVHPDVATDLNNLGAVSYDLGDYPKAIEYYEEALTIWWKIYQEKHQNIAATLNNLGKAYFALDQEEKAQKCFDEAHEILKELLGPEHPFTKAVGS